MSISLTPSQVQDLILGTLKNLGKDKYNVLAQRFRYCVVVDKWFKRAEKQSGGNGWQRQVMTRFSTAARHSSPYAVDNLQRQNLMAQITGNWVHLDSHMIFNYQELLINRASAERIFNVIQTQRAGMLGNVVETLEKAAWQCPAAGNTLDPLGVPYWIVYNHGNIGFTGGAASGYTTVAGLNPDSVPNDNWKNYSATYSAVTSADLVKKLRTALLKLDWKDVVKVQSYRNGSAEMVLYTTDTIAEELIDIYESRNDNLGPNIGGSAGSSSQRDSSLYRIDNELVVRGRPVVNVPLLETSDWTGPTGPVYMIDHSTFGVVGLEGDWFREGRVEPVPGQHNNFASYLDLTYNYWCHDRRRNAVIATGNPS